MDSEEPLKILIADDSNSDRLLLKAIVQNLGHEVVVAADGEEAVEAFLYQKPQIILMDALMPRMDGFEAAEKIKALSGEDFIPIIFLTSLKEADSLALCLEAGGDDFLTKPYNNVILKAKINAFRRMIRMHTTLQEQRDQIAHNHRHLIQEQEVAKRVFDKVAHAGCLHIKNINYTLSPLAVFNGDVLLATVRPSGSVFVLLGDFTGHGLAAAIGAMPLAQTFYSMSAKGFSMQEVLKEINFKLKDILPVGVFCCACMIDLNMRDKTIEVWNGGLPDCYLYHSDIQEYEVVPSRHLPLGILSSKDFNNKTHIYEMRVNDRFFMWSDGILEAENRRGEMFGEERVRDIFGKGGNGERLFETLNQRIVQFVGNSDPSDDLSIAEIIMVDQEQFEGSNEFQRDFRLQGPMDWGLRYEVRPDTLREYNPLPLLLQILMDIPGLRPHSGEIYTILAELYSNALEHGVLELDSSLKSSTAGFAEYYRLRTERLAELQVGYVIFDLAYKGDDHGGALTIKVCDSGKGFDFEGYLNNPVSAQGYSGRGVGLLRSICRSIRYLQGGCEVEVVYDWSYHRSDRRKVATVA